MTEYTVSDVASTQYSKVLTVRVTPALMKQLERRAKREDRSTGYIVRQLLEKALKESTK